MYLTTKWHDIMNILKNVELKFFRQSVRYCTLKNKLLGIEKNVNRFTYVVCTRLKWKTALIINTESFHTHSVHTTISRTKSNCNYD